MSIGSRHDVPSASCVRRAALEQQPYIARAGDPAEGRDLWFVTVTIGGAALALRGVREALERLSVERAFVVSIRYDRNRAQVRYWDECDDAAEATRQALSLWGDDEVFAELPGWRVSGLEVVDLTTAQQQWNADDHPRVYALGEIVPFDD
ncbi:hypothetical protein KIH74_31690 [Kineosporia sp. J2-2]|uniref:Uncharacterized protein n=1 Tax=Kineosporia corallincola TaxID=2835133 RepID=A0ABS5TRW5_9ACTN|nr:hypothetical protein [Kineosporia corallincola]MBT0773551.1 hypothetical protein [Kineosporia corallincola]